MQSPQPSLRARLPHWIQQHCTRLAAYLRKIWQSLFTQQSAPSAQPPALPQHPNKRKFKRRSPQHLRKPEWVIQSILELKAHLPQGTGVRTIAATFNRLQQSIATHPSTDKPLSQTHQKVSKSYVAQVLLAHELVLGRARQTNSTPAPIGTILSTWGIDLTGKQDTRGQTHSILGIIDHGSRKLISLLVSSKHSQTLAQHLQNSIRLNGKPKNIRTDNEPCFQSEDFKRPIQEQNIKHQSTQRHCPWQNGKIERLFGTLKQQLNRIQIHSADHLQSLLDEFKHWYNEVRLHQHLKHQTPQEIWQSQAHRSNAHTAASAQTNLRWWQGWVGQLSGIQWTTQHQQTAPPG